MIAVCPLDQPPTDSTARVGADVPVAVVDVDGGLRTVDDACTSEDASLADGWVEGYEVEDPLRAAASAVR